MEKNRKLRLMNLKKRYAELMVIIKGLYEELKKLRHEQAQIRKAIWAYQPKFMGV